ncbi:MAG: hypothetical protein JW807_17935 [Spirochaetes bacterium]|nr:hypothetical protein [Spirochaetota bacterium]
MRFLPVIKKSERKLFDFTGACNVTIDNDKYQLSRDIYLTGLNNYTLFQKFSNFKWPAWINAMTDPSSGAAAFVPLMLVNNALRDSIYFTNFLSEEGIHVDPAGMISPSFGHWSIETWVAAGGAIYRPADDRARIKQERDIRNSIIRTSWENELCRVQQTIYGARSSVDEAVIETECTVRDRKHASVLFVVRPYDQAVLGGLESVEYAKDSSSLTINGKKSACFAVRPDAVIAGDGEQCGDIVLDGGDRHARSASKLGMATLALGYSLKKGDNRFIFRMALDSRGGITPGKYDFTRVRQDYTEFTTIRIRNGANISLPDRLLQNWFYGSKIALLNFSSNHLAREGGEIDYRRAYYIIFGYNRMGYTAESLALVDNLIKSFTPDEKSPSFFDVIDACRVIHAIADYFIHVRDTGFLQERFGFIKQKAFLIYNYAHKIKKPGSHAANSLPHYSIAEEHPFDFILITHALAQFSYMARCLGIFGDELKFRKESDRMTALLNRMAFDDDPGRVENEFILYNLFAGFPFRVDGVPEASLRGLLDRMRAFFDGMPLFVKSLGWDVFSSLVAAVNLIFLKDRAGFDVIENLLRLRGKTFSLPEFMNPATGRASWGEGASIPVSAMAFASIRSLLFIDHPERLDLFPLPRAEWFEPGNEIKIEDVPSRFGPISLRMASTVNEIQIHFDKLPKFVPPDIMITLPYKTKIKHEDDFILKREEDTSFIINGWPSIVRFIRK